MEDRLLFDSSAIISLCSRKKLDKLLEGCTLNLALYELGNAVWRQVCLRKALTLEEGKMALDGLILVVGRLKKAPDSSQGILELAVKEGLTYYDASYLHAAIQSNMVLVTDDEKLSSIAKKFVETLKSDKL